MWNLNKKWSRMVISTFSRYNSRKMPGTLVGSSCNNNVLCRLLRKIESRPCNLSRYVLGWKTKYWEVVRVSFAALPPWAGWTKGKIWLGKEKTSSSLFRKESYWVTFLQIYIQYTVLVDGCSYFCNVFQLNVFYSKKIIPTQSCQNSKRQSGSEIFVSLSHSSRVTSLSFLHDNWCDTVEGDWFRKIYLSCVTGHE